MEGVQVKLATGSEKRAMRLRKRKRLRLLVLLDATFTVQVELTAQDEKRQVTLLLRCLV